MTSPPTRIAAGPVAAGARRRDRRRSPPPKVARAPGGARRDAASAATRPTRPGVDFGQARPQQGKSIFGEDLISDKSLDEVILSYLAEDLDGDSKK